MTEGHWNEEGYWMWGTGEAVEKPPNYFGDCPECHQNDGFLNVHKNHWFFCDEHQTRWHAGWNLFSGWREETEEEWDLNAMQLSGYNEVEPYIHPSFIATAEEKELTQGMTKYVRNRLAEDFGEMPF
jgi:hypothetical protein